MRLWDRYLALGRHWWFMPLAFLVCVIITVFFFKPPG